MAFPEEGSIVGHYLFQTVILVVVRGNQNRIFCVLGLCARCWMKKAMPVHASGCNCCILEEVYGIPSIQEV